MPGSDSVRLDLVEQHRPEVGLDVAPEIDRVLVAGRVLQPWPELDPASPVVGQGLGDPPRCPVGAAQDVGLDGGEEGPGIGGGGKGLVRRGTSTARVAPPGSEPARGQLLNSPEAAATTPPGRARGGHGGCLQVTDKRPHEPSEPTR